jgi:hypothetical protein
VNEINPRRFEVRPKRWIVERTWLCLMNNRPLQVDYERDTVVTGRLYLGGPQPTGPVPRRGSPGRSRVADGVAARSSHPCVRQTRSASFKAAVIASTRVLCARQRATAWTAFMRSCATAQSARVSGLAIMTAGSRACSSSDSGTEPA